MKLSCVFILMFFFSCSTGKEDTLDSPQQNLSYFDKIFTNSEPLFNGKKLGEDLIQDSIKKNSLSESGFFTLSLLAFEEKINKFELEVHIESEEKATILIEKIVTKFNVHLNQNKSVSKFVTWSYTTDNNLPAEILLIYEKELNEITLEIGYKSQR